MPTRDIDTLSDHMYEWGRVGLELIKSMPKFKVYNMLLKYNITRAEFDGTPSQIPAF